MMKIVAVLISACLVFAFPQKIAAETVHFVSFNETGNAQWEESYVSGSTPWDVFNFMFTENLGCLPTNTALLDIWTDNGHLYINASSDIRSYGGGSCLERNLAAQIIRSALDITGVDKVTLLIDGELDCLPEGTVISAATHWGNINNENQLD